MESGYKILSTISTPWDDLIPIVPENQTRFYLDIIRIYLGLYSGNLSMDVALRAVEQLKENPQYALTPIDPTLFPLNESIKSKIIENLNTLKKYNLYTTDSVKSAYSFAVLPQDAPLNQNDIDVLKAFILKPNESFVKISEKLGIASRTAARSLERMHNRRQIRFTCLTDLSAFGIKEYILFFRVKEGIDWIDIENSLTHYQFIKGILKTSMTDLGYFTFMIPDVPEYISVFKKSTNELANVIFDYMTLHEREIAGSHINLSLFDGIEWSKPENFESFFETSQSRQEKTVSKKYLINGGLKQNLIIEDLAIASHLATDFRQIPSKLSQILSIRGWHFDSKQVSSSIRRLLRNDVVLPCVVISGVNLSTAFVFEVVCNEKWRNKLMERIPLLPSSVTFTSDKGIIVWTSVPSYHQVDYYQLFRSLQTKSGIKSVQPIMTLQSRGSRQMYDFIKLWDKKSEGWSIDPNDLDLTQFIGY